MKFLKTVITLTLIYTLLGTTLSYASSIDPAINRVTLSQGERTYGSVTYTNSEDSDIEVSLTPFVYNPLTDDISEEKEKIFLKTDTDSITVKGKSSFEVKYEIYPLSNQELGTYYNILALTPASQSENVKINMSISQLVILDIVDPKDQVKGVTTNQYGVQIEVINKGIPFLKPTVIKYTFVNNSNYLLVPQGRLDIFNEKNSYKPTYVYINKESKKVYPNQTLEEEIEIDKWYIQDIYIKRLITGEIYNGVDNNPYQIESSINSFTVELIGILVLLLIGTLLMKSVKQDLKKR